MIEGVFFSILILWKCVTPCMIDPFCIGAFPWRISSVFHPPPTPHPFTPLHYRVEWFSFFCDFQKWTHSFCFKEQSPKRKFGENLFYQFYSGPGAHNGQNGFWPGQWKTKVLGSHNSQVQHDMCPTIFSKNHSTLSSTLHLNPLFLFLIVMLSL